MHVFPIPPPSIIYAAMLLLMKSLGLLIAVLVHYVWRTADYSILHRQRTPHTGALCAPVSSARVLHVRTYTRMLL